MTGVRLVFPSREHLPEYVAALERGWSADNVRKEAAAREELAAIARDADAFLAARVDREARGAPIPLPDGTFAQRLPGYTCWIVDGAAFCGSINLRWQPGTAELPPHVLGHIGYAVVPWQRGKGIATEALRQMLDHARGEGLPHVILTCDPDNVASIRTIERNGGVLLGTFTKTAYGGAAGLKYRIDLA